MIILNVVWPAIYVSTEIAHFWFLILATIILETFVIRIILQYPLRTSFLASLAGNLVSGVIGTFVMMWAMVIWHFVADPFVPEATFGIINWVATYILMCLGSVLIETLTIKLIFKDTVKRLFLPLLTGNLLTYAFIAYSMAKEAVH